MIYRIPVTTLLHQTDWHRTRLVFDHIWHLIDQGSLDQHRSFNHDYVSQQYDLGGYGSIIDNNILTDGSPWRTWTGTLLEKTLPWAKALKERLQASHLNFQGFSYSRHFDSIKKHIDGKTDHDRQTSDQGHCNVNFITVSNDPKAFTYCVDQLGQQQSYSSVPGQAWLLCTNIEHGIISQGLREVFQIKFHTDFNRVRDWLYHHSDLLDADHY